MPFEPGHKHSPGRKKGVPNKINADLRQMILDSLEDAGGKDYLRKQAIENPSAYLALVGKVIPKEMAITGPDGGPIQHSINVKFE